MAHSLDNSSSSNNNTINTEAAAAVVDEVADVAVGVGTKIKGMVHQVATSHINIKAVVDSIIRRLVEVTVTCTLAVAMEASPVVAERSVPVWEDRKSTRLNSSH